MTSDRCGAVFNRRLLLNHSRCSCKDIFFSKCSWPDQIKCIVALTAPITCKDTPTEENGYQVHNTPLFSI